MISNLSSSLQLDRRKEEVATIYNLASEGYDRQSLNFFSLSAIGLVEWIQPQLGDLILDVGTGTGATAILAAKRCEPGGRVIGIDIAVEMLRVASRKAEAAGISNLEFQLGDAESLNFPANTFDLVLSTASLFFLTDMLAGLKKWKQVCKTGGRIALSGFGLNAFQPLSDLFEKLIRSYGVTFPVPHHPFSWQRLTEPDQYLELLHQAGYQEVQVYSKQLGYYLNGADEWWEVIFNSGFRGPISRLSPRQLGRFKLEHLAQIGSLADSRGIWLDLPVIFATGRKLSQ